MNAICFEDEAIRSRLRHAAVHHTVDAVSIVIPAKQEAASIASVIERSRGYARDVLVVVGRSTDGTAEIASARGASVFADGGRGKGEAMRRAIPHLRTPVAVFLDADGSHDPEDIPLLVAPILADEADHVVASRLRGGSSELHGGFDEFLRLTGSSFITACINRRFGCQLSDSQNGFRAIKTSVLGQLNLRENTTTIEQEMTIKTLRGGWRMSEVPSHEHRREHGVSHIRVLRDAPRYGYSLVKYLFF
jgi:glycosyltransferase involved in cell wall biosynthesis